MGARRRVWAEVLWAAERLRQRLKRDLRLAIQELPSDTVALFERVKVLRDVAVPMRDGVLLRADVYLPDDERQPDGARSARDGAVLSPPTLAAPSRLPVVLIRLPYGKREAYCYMPAHGRFWARRGYACVIQDVRGKWASEGIFEPYEHEAEDGWDTLDWVAAQPWCDGNIGMTGESYYGSTQWAVAPLSHPSLRCVAPGNVDPDRYGAVHDGGALCLATAGEWAFEISTRRYLNRFRFDTWHLPLATSDRVAGRETVAYQRLVQHPSRDACWDELDAPCRYEDVPIPMLHWVGWWDVHTNGTIDGWRRVRERATLHTARERQWLVLGATDHELTPEFTGRIGRVEVPGHGWSHDRVRRFMDSFLKSQGGFEETPRVQYFVVGANEWRGADDWPPKGVDYVEHFLHGDGRSSGGEPGGRGPAGEGTAGGGSAGGGWLDTEPPAGEPADDFAYDPADPVQAWVGRSIWSMAAELGDRREVEARRDVLVYTGGALAEPLEATGPLQVRLFAASSARDTDFTAALVDVFPDGHAQLVREGIVRGRYRQTEREPVLLEPNRVYEYTIELGSVSYVFPAGHRLRLEISSSNFDRYDRNQNTGGLYAADARLQVARQRILHDRRHPSCLVLPVFRDG